ncbi:hypothetical protein AOL_s00004g497 [Orbilia oligospora ATCC 24927]|uniref:Uncharacterized protein n=1 Tax=Arthrobotrys oligospora (strain ATCC 24927 / CBS 115.81 / DSM 1491) TaxID=756982 RepID=G1WYY6_ARTOA|nr:hypothetical protein AOL_s00004g497 [Orbilia oligospora ATCC 24927]EGX53838.1 hypothetical protein AOL_s00004g497 [Orbilia oligospora ATCC 24927]
MVGFLAIPTAHTSTSASLVSLSSTKTTVGTNFLMMRVEVYVPPEHQPINPEDEDDVIPDQHAAFGIARAQQKEREPLWKDLNLADLLHRAPTEGDVPRIRSKFPR